MARKNYIWAISLLMVCATGFTVAAQEMLQSKYVMYIREGIIALARQANMDPVNEAVKDGYHQELSDKLVAKHSAYSYEDLPSDKFGAYFGASYFDPNSKQTFGEQLKAYLDSLGATIPQKAPNYIHLPKVEQKTPSRTNHSTTPVFTQENP